MDAIRKQARKLSEQVAKQQQAVLKQFGGSQAPQHSETVITDEAELQRHQQLERLYTTTKAGKGYQREIVKGVEGLVATGIKQVEVVTRLAEDCRKYGTEGPGMGGALGRASVHYSNAETAVEKEREAFHRAITTQVAEPLKAMIMGAPLEDARHLTQRYDRLRQEAEAQVAEVENRKTRTREPKSGPENTVKLQIAEQKMAELSSAMAVLGKEAASAMTAVEAQQQRLTLQRLIALVEAERAFHARAAEILDQLHAEMVSERQRSESLPPQQGVFDSMPPPSYEDVKSNGNRFMAAQKAMFFLAEVMHSFEAESEGELSLTAGDYVVVRQVSPTGWSEGECKGKAGWFPSAYVEQRQRMPANKILDAGNI
eukprot:SM000349S12878  [mRNA]  locus=s349:82217:85018:+ [translate_table: standard]